ncbi:sensor histidine kinase [Paraliomyxa miuraensis]|uniref:sensor histidine kinase n=1 Tax=Paraliomyxa miuraensis TaxID=376150 RepID=UPI00225395DA|nr:ATP-binding protein [Paraliomyxa miuraensis]MCX4243261.1 ATP-binding protein [Paraliomyxa miuraensis]
MSTATSEPRSDFFVRVLAVVGVAGLVHLVIGHATLGLLLASETEIAHGREVISLAVLATLLAQLGTLVLRSRDSDPGSVAVAVPNALRVAAPVSAVLLALLVLPPELLGEGGVRTMVALVPTTAAVWSAAHLVAIPMAQVLQALAIRDPGGRAPRTGAPPPLLSREIRTILTEAAWACALVVLASLVHHLGRAPSLDLAMMLPTGWLLAFPLLTAMAGVSLGQVPGQDLSTVARRLDEPPPAAEPSPGAVTPIVVTRSDEVGELLANLEALRRRLEEDLNRYESVLEQAQSAERTKSDFLSAVSHELRTPLNVIGGFTQLLLEGHPAPLTEAQAEDVRLIRGGGKQLLELINDILDISMIESGELRLSFSRTDLGALVRQTVDFHRPQLRDEPVTLRAEVAPGLPPAICDRRRIGQILNNLVSNAIKFTEEGEIVVRLAFDPKVDAVILSCIDTGVGIEAAELDVIFEEYRQAGTRNRRKKGTGLGLAIARSIAEHHGGRLAAESAVGVGSTFTLTLPLDPPGRPASIDVTEEAARAVVRRTFRPGELRAADLLR